MAEVFPPNYHQYIHQQNSIYQTIQNSERCPNRTILIVPYHNGYHNPDIKGNINLCDYIVFPKTVTCVKEHPDVLVKKYSCSTPCVDGAWDCHPYTYGLQFCKTFDSCGIKRIRREQVDICSDECLLLYGWNHPSINHSFMIQFTPYITSLAHRVKNLLGFQGNTFSVIHWRRFDAYKDDKSVNSKIFHAQDLIVAIKNIENANTTGLQYVATNELNKTELLILKENKIKTSLDISEVFHDLSSADLFFVELILMIEANLFVSWGFSTVHSLVDIGRKQRARSRSTSK